MSEKMGWEERIKDITTAYFVGLNLAVPPFNGKHSQEFFSQLYNLNQEETKRARLDLIKEISDQMFEIELYGGGSIEGITRPVLEALKSSLEENKESDPPVIGKRWDKVHFID